MDGVLVDVSDSYREAIRATVAHFSGQQITRELIQDYKNTGGWNNDWALSQKILLDLGFPVEYQIVVERFQLFFFGDNGGTGLIERERWIPSDGLLDRLQERYGYAIFTGRLRAEAEITLRRFAAQVPFDKIVADDDVAHSKPAPDGLLQIASAFPGRKLWYVGDTIDDARSARNAGVPFIGIAGLDNPRHEELAALLRREGAAAVLRTMNELESVL